MKSLRDILRNDQAAFRGAIIADILRQVPVFKSYKGMCFLLEDKTLNYVEYEYLYMYYAKGGRDLNVDFSKRQNRCSLMDMPLDVLSEIQKRCELRSIIALGLATPACQEYNDKHFSKFANLEIHYGVSDIRVLFNQKTIHYKEASYGCMVKCDQEKERFIEGVGYQNLAFSELRPVLENEHLEVGKLTIDHKFEIGCDPFENFFSSVDGNRKTRMKVRNVKIASKDLVFPVRILKIIEAETLEIITLHARHWDFNSHSLMLLDQYMQAKIVSIFAGRKIFAQIPATDEIETWNLKYELDDFKNHVLTLPINFKAVFILNEEINVANVAKELGADITDESAQIIEFNQPFEKSDDVLHIFVSVKKIVLERRIEGSQPLAREEPEHMWWLIT